MTALIKFGHVREIPQEAIDTREVEFVISDESKDRHNTILKADGWELDNYNKNSIVGYQHNVYGGGMCSGPDPDMVIGKGHARIEGVETIGKVFFEPADLAGGNDRLHGLDIDTDRAVIEARGPYVLEGHFCVCCWRHGVFHHTFIDVR